MRWGIGVVALAVVLGLALPGGSGAASAPSYEEAPIYTPAPVRRLRLHFAGFRRNLRSGTAVLYVIAPSPGRVLLHGRGLRRLRRTARRERQRVRLVVRPKVRLMHYLKHHRRGKIRAIVTFTPADGAVPETIERPIALKRRHR